MKYTLQVNGQLRPVAAEPETPLLWVLRDELKLTGSKSGCGIGQCGACTVHVGGNATRSCLIPVSSVENQLITTIEAVAGREAQAVRRAWIDREVPQCGFCQSGQIMSAVALLRDKPAPTDADIDDAMRGNLCRCATYLRIRAAIHDAARMLKS